MTSLPLPGHGPARKGEDYPSLPAPSARNAALAHLAPERRERDHGRAIFLTGPFVSTRTVGRVSLNSDMGSKPEVRPSASISHPRASSRAACAGGLADLLPRRGLRRFQFLGRIYRAVRTRLLLRFNSSQEPKRRVTQSLKTFSSVVSHVVKEQHEAVRWNEKVLPNSTKVLVKVT